MKEFIEKLIGRLEEKLALADKEKERCVKENLLQFDSAKGYSSGMANAISIVNQFAEEYNNDFCGWFRYDYRTIAPKNHDAENPYWRIPDNMDKLKYCPYCGKKIRVAPYPPKGE